ncbi:MAG: signal peptidase II [Clostridia bacterium]|nr:signal peptidase II [Clostridia bacterium]MBQ3056969.1 signal peptidase II [Clostridia bacterium]
MLWIIMVIAVIAAVILVDQISKILVLAYLYEEQIDLIEGVLRFTYVENRGMAFGLLADHRWIFLICSVVGIGLIAFYLFRYVHRNLSRVSLALIIGGGIGNMIDRLRLGFVVDFIDFCAFDFWVWVFNVADATVCVGAALFVLDLILEMVADIKKNKVLKASGEKSEPQQGEDQNG